MAFASSLPLHRSLLSPLTFPHSHSHSHSLKVYNVPQRNAFKQLRCSLSVASKRGQGEFDPELRLVLELASDSELYELEKILFGPSYFSPLLKSVTRKADVDYAMIGEDLEEREGFIKALESRFLFLAADARSTLRGWRPSYRSVLLAVRKKLNVPCSSKLSTEDLEAEIFLHLVKEYSREESGIFPGLWESSDSSDDQGSLQHGLSQQKIESLSAQELGAQDLKSIILKGGSMFTLGKVYQFLAEKLTGKLLQEAAKYQIQKEVIKKGGQLAAINLESRVALLAAKQGFSKAAARFLGLRSMASLLGPMLWGTLMADVVIQMLGTDYARILRAIYAFAQIRITRTYQPAMENDCS